MNCYSQAEWLVAGGRGVLRAGEDNFFGIRFGFLGIFWGFWSFFGSGSQKIFQHTVPEKILKTFFKKLQKMDNFFVQWEGESPPPAH